MPGNARLFQESITHELDAIKNRVRNLIGSAHWGEEGRFKEVVLKNILRKFLPSNLSVGTGFIMKADGANDNENVLSSQLDIIIYDNTLPLLFSEGDFIITTASNVRGIIEVKARITQYTFQNVLEQFDHSIHHFVNAFNDPEKKIFMGIFAFDFQGGINHQNLETSLVNSQHLVNHIALGKDFFIRKWRQEDAIALAVEADCPNGFYNFYGIDRLAFSYFISNLISITSGGLDDRYWIAFPIEGTKEVHRAKTVCI